MKRIALHWQILGGMLLGAIVGIALNASVGVRQTTLKEGLPDGIRELAITDSPNRIDIHVTDDTGKTREIVVEGTGVVPNAFATVKQLRTKDKTTYALFKKYGRSRSRTVGDWANKLGGLFLRLLKMVAVPLIVASLMSGVLGLGQPSQLGRMFSRTLLYYVCTSLLAIVTGLAMVNLIRPGLGGVNPPAGLEPPSVSGNLGDVLFGQVEKMIPTNPINAVAQSEFLSIISFSIAFSIFTIFVGGKVADTIRQLAKASFEVMMAMTMAIVKLAPIGVTLLMLGVTATQGPAVFRSLAWYMVAVLLALAIHALVVLPLIVRFIAHRSPLEFARAMSPALLTAFSSASSNGTLPLTLTCVEERAKISNRVSSFVLPLGATINMDGTALYEAVAVLFIAQMHHGVNLPLQTQIIVAFTALLASIGAAGIPHAGLVMMVIILQVLNLPLEMQGIIIAVDRVLDMCRTSVNVWSDSCGCAVVAYLESNQGPPLEAPIEGGDSV